MIVSTFKLHWDPVCRDRHKTYNRHKKDSYEEASGNYNFLLDLSRLKRSIFTYILVYTSLITE